MSRAAAFQGLQELRSYFGVADRSHHTDGGYDAISQHELNAASGKVPQAANRS